jgi:CRISPR/Cas system CSM-associated protein Csm3 (group 7 of RAMP superfamily)
VNPGTGVAERASLRRDEYVDAPTTLTVHLMHPGEPATALLEALATWQPVIGRRRTNGWGRAAVTSIRYGRVDLGDDEHLVRWLIGGGPALVDAFATVPVDPAPVSSAIEVLRVRWAVVDGLHIGTGEPVALAADAGNDRGRTMEVADVVARDQVAYVPASSWRGVFRAHAGFILRSLGLSDEPTEAAVAVLFGSVERRGLLTFHDAQLTEPVCEDRSHVGIDRITGGARPGLLFGERSVRGTMDLRVSAELPAEVPDWARNLLRHTVRDIADGFLAVGGRTTRGLGTLAILDRTDVAEPDGVDIDVVAAAVAHLAGAAEEGGTE